MPKPLPVRANNFGGLGEEKIMLLKMPEQPVSSTKIRECIKNGESIDGMVPEAVRDYILEKGYTVKRKEGNNKCLQIQENEGYAGKKHCRPNVLNIRSAFTKRR